MSEYNWWDRLAMLEKIQKEGALPFRPGEKTAGVGIQKLAWQLRSGTLQLQDGHVAVNVSVLAVETPEAHLEIMRGRCDEINQIIDLENLQPATMAELIEIFNFWEDRQNESKN